MNVNNFASIEQITGQYINSRTASDKNVKDTHISFTQALDNAKSLQSSEVTFSKHASERLKTRNISLTDNQLNRLNEGARKAQNKGITESLVLLDDLAFIVNTKNNTVITAMNSNSQEENVYTNIDGAVVMQPDRKEAISP